MGKLATKIATTEYDDLPLFSVGLIEDEFAGLWDFERRPEPEEPIPPVVTFQVGEWVEQTKLGIYARRDGMTAINGDAEVTGQGIMKMTAMALSSIPSSTQLDIYTTVPPLVKTFTKGVRLKLPDRDASQQVPVKLMDKYTQKGPLPTGNLNQWNVAKQLGRHQRVRWHLVESLPSTERLLAIEFTLDDVQEMEF